MNLDNQKTERNLRKQKEGRVVGNCQNKTIIVEVVMHKTHPLYKKVVKDTKKYYAHDENNEAGIGDKVLIAETKPISKKKRWRLVKVQG